MKNLYILFLLFFFFPARAIIVSDGTNVCGLYAYDKMYATYELNSYTCAAGQFLPANAIACASCPTDYSCSGGIFYFNAKNNQGLSNQTTFTNNLTNVCAKNAPHGFIARYEAISYTCNAGYYLPADETECAECPSGNVCSGGTYSFNETTDQGITACPAGKYSTGGASSCSNVYAGYFCSGGCTTATPTSSSDCLTGNTCGQCLTDSVTGRPAYSGAGAASCSVCPAVTGELAGRVYNYNNSYWVNNIHNRIGGCAANLYDDDPDGTYITKCFYSTTDNAYGGPNSRCETWGTAISACAAGKYDTITPTSSSYAYCGGVDCMKGKVCTNTMAGYYSPEGARTQTACPVGKYSAAGAASCSDASTGYYASGCTDDGTTCTGQSQCTGTTYCVAGVQYSCPTGYTANTTDGKSAISQCQASCAAGNYMASGTYTKLEYLQSSGTQYINTGIKTSYGLVVTASFSTNVERTLLFGGRKSSSGVQGITWGYINPAGAHNMYGTVSGGNVLTKNFLDNQQHTIVLSPTALTLDGVPQTHNTFSDQVGNNDIYLFTWNNGGTADGRMWQGKVYGFSIADANDNMVQNLIPARRNSDNVLGMLDLVSGQFFTNAGTDTFVAGPDVDVIGGTCTDTSSAGYYATATTIGYGTPAPQTACALNTYSASGAASCTACPVGTFTPTGSAVCYPHRLHIGDDVVYVRSTKLTTPSLNIDIDRDGVADFFVNMTTTRTRMNKDSTHYFHAQWENNDYYICDDTTYDK